MVRSNGAWQRPVRPVATSHLSLPSPQWLVLSRRYVFCLLRAFFLIKSCTQDVTHFLHWFHTVRAKPETSAQAPDS